MGLGPNTKAFFQRVRDEVRANPAPPPIDQVPIEMLRKATIDVFREYAGSLPDSVSASSFKNHSFNLPEGKSVHAKIYTPNDFDPSSNSTVIFFQGNGFSFDMLEAHLPGVARMANAASCQVIAIDTPLAPEHAAQEINDMSYEVVRYIFQNAVSLNANPENIILVGYSSGGNIVANIVSKARTDDVVRIKYQILLSPSMDLSLQTTIDNPYLEYQNKDESVSLEALSAVVKMYYQDNDPKTPLISPMFEKDLSGFPPTTIVLAEFDGARGDGEMYAKKLEAAGVPVEVRICKGQTHNYFIARGVMNDSPDPAEVVAEVIRNIQ